MFCGLLRQKENIDPFSRGMKFASSQPKTFLCHKLLVMIFSEFSRLTLIFPILCFSCCCLKRKIRNLRRNFPQILTVMAELFIQNFSLNDGRNAWISKFFSQNKRDGNHKRNHLPYDFSHSSLQWLRISMSYHRQEICIKDTKT